MGIWPHKRPGANPVVLRLGPGGLNCRLPPPQDWERQRSVRPRLGGVTRFRARASGEVQAAASPAGLDGRGQTSHGAKSTGWASARTRCVRRGTVCGRPSIGKTPHGTRAPHETEQMSRRAGGMSRTGGADQGEFEAATKERGVVRRTAKMKVASRHLLVEAPPWQGRRFVRCGGSPFRRRSPRGAFGVRGRAVAAGASRRWCGLRRWR